MTTWIRWPRLLLPFATVISLFALPSRAPAQPTASNTPVAGPYLYPEVLTLDIKPTRSGNFIKIKGSLMVANLGLKQASNVSVTAYIAERTPRPGKLAEELPLPASRPEFGVIVSGTRASVPIMDRLPKIFASAVNGRYLFIVLKANGFAASKPVFYGPLSVQ